MVAHRTHRRRWAVLAGLWLLVMACVTKPSPAPGCTKRLFPTFGGCFGKTAILNLEYQGPDCLKIQVNNCQGGELQVTNACEVTLSIGELVIPAGERENLDLAEREGGHQLVRRSSIPTYAPAEELHLTFEGTLGADLITLSFTKTAPLCP